MPVTSLLCSFVVKMEKKICNSFFRRLSLASTEQAAFTKDSHTTKRSTTCDFTSYTAVFRSEHLRDDSRQNRAFYHRDLTWSNFRIRSFCAQSIEPVEKPLNPKFHDFLPFRCRARRGRTLDFKKREDQNFWVLNLILLIDVSSCFFCKIR